MITYWSPFDSKNRLRLVFYTDPWWKRLCARLRGQPLWHRTGAIRTELEGTDMKHGDNADNPQRANLNPTAALPPLTINGIPLDMERVAAIAETLGMQEDDVLSISGYRNSKGQLVPDYDSITIERKAGE